MTKPVNKIAIISNSLGIGGAERFSGLLSSMLTQLGFEVHVIIVQNFVSFPYEGKLVNLEVICYHKFSIIKKLKKGLFLNSYLKKNKIDTIIDNRARNFLIRDIITYFIFKKTNQIYVVHTAIISMCFSKYKWVNQFLYGKADKIVCVAKSIENLIVEKFDLKNVTTIYNFVSLKEDLNDVTLNLPEHFFLYFGRLQENPKNLIFLIESFKKSKIFEKNYKLLLLGSGDSEILLQNKINELKLNNHILILPFTQSVSGYVKKAKATVLTSKHEGFPLSIIESLALGTPVISVDCESGPREIIKNEYNGLLIEPNNIDAFANALTIFVSNDTLYQNCKNNAKDSVAHLSLEKIQNQWLSILK